LTRIAIAGWIRRTYALAAAMLALELFVFSTAPSWSAPTGIIIIPTAETVGENQYSIELQFDGEFPTGRASERILNTQFGIGPRLEAGVDFDFSKDADSRLLGNAKYMLISENEGLPDLAVGVDSIFADEGSVPYIVATQPWGCIRGHFGCQRCEGRNRWFVGSDYAPTERLTFMADYTSGKENFSSAGVDYQFADKFAITAGVQFPNSREEDTLYTLQFVFGGTYRK
jgi:hypothetical protein